MFAFQKNCQQALLNWLQHLTNTTKIISRLEQIHYHLAWGTGSGLCTGIIRHTSSFLSSKCYDHLPLLVTTFSISHNFILALKQVLIERDYAILLPYFLS